MTTTLREPATTAPSLLTADQDAENPENGCGLAERRGLTAERPNCGRRSDLVPLIGEWRADELLGWSRALETRLVTFEEWRRWA